MVKLRVSHLVKYAIDAISISSKYVILESYCFQRDSDGESYVYFFLP